MLFNFFTKLNIKFKIVTHFLLPRVAFKGHSRRSGPEGAAGLASEWRAPTPSPLYAWYASYASTHLFTWEHRLPPPADVRAASSLYELRLTRCGKRYHLNSPLSSHNFNVGDIYLSWQWPGPCLYCMLYLNSKVWSDRKLICHMYYCV
jgi:hypothetical protein